jgi:hypothetical protein
MEEGIEDGIDQVAPLHVDAKNPIKSVVERYFTQYFAFGKIIKRIKTRPLNIIRVFIMFRQPSN